MSNNNFYDFTLQWGRQFGMNVCPMVQLIGKWTNGFQIIPELREELLFRISGFEIAIRGDFWVHAFLTVGSLLIKIWENTTFSTWPRNSSVSAGVYWQKIFNWLAAVECDYLLS